jgi:cyclopropane fatty-acyl-phospholipid synthase-like methyltransferase
MGIDISPQQVEFCKNHVTSNVKLADIEKYLLQDTKDYELITGFDIIEHFSKDKIPVILKAIFAALKTDGTLILRVPNLGNPFSLISRYRDFTHEIGFTETSLYQVLYIAGFRSIEISSSQIIVKSMKSRIRCLLVGSLFRMIRFFYYIQDFTAPKHLGRNLIAVCRK